MVKTVNYKEKTLAVYVRSEDWKEGLHFVGKESDFLQIGLWHYESGKKLGPHKHVINNRSISYTQEMIFIKKGRLEASIYSNDDKLVETVELRSGDFMLLCSGGHGYRITEDGTQVLEVKNGPYTGSSDRVPV